MYRKDILSQDIILYPLVILPIEIKIYIIPIPQMGMNITMSVLIVQKL